MTKSKGRERKEAKNPATALAASVLLRLDHAGARLSSCALASEKNASCPKLRAMARTTVGAAPAHKAPTPSLRTILVTASTTER